MPYILLWKAMNKKLMKLVDGCRIIIAEIISCYDFISKSFHIDHEASSIQSKLSKTLQMLIIDSNFLRVSPLTLLIKVFFKKNLNELYSVLEFTERILQF